MGGVCVCVHNMGSARIYDRRVVMARVVACEVCVHNMGSAGVCVCVHMGSVPWVCASVQTGNGVYHRRVVVAVVGVVGENRVCVCVTREVCVCVRIRISVFVPVQLIQRRNIHRFKHLQHPHWRQTDVGLVVERGRVMFGHFDLGMGRHGRQDVTFGSRSGRSNHSVRRTLEGWFCCNLVAREVEQESARSEVVLQESVKRCWILDPPSSSGEQQYILV